MVAQLVKGMLISTYVSRKFNPPNMSHQANLKKTNNMINNISDSINDIDVNIINKSSVNININKYH